MFKKIIYSAKNLGDLRCICTTALLIALYVALYAVQIPLSPQLRITFTFIPLAICGWLFGCVPATLAGFLCDILSFLSHPTGPYYIGFTITSILSGFVYGLFLYGKKGGPLIWSVILSKAIVTLFLNIALNSYWISIYYGSALFSIPRITKNVIMLPIEIILLIGVIEALVHAGVQKIYKSPQI